MTRTKKIGQMTSKAIKEIAEKIVRFFGGAGITVFLCPHGREDVLTAAIGRPEHPGRVRVAGADVTIKQYFGSTPRTSGSSSSMAPEELEQLTQQIRDQLKELITKKSDSEADGILQPDAVQTDPETGDSDKRRLYIEENPSHLVALGRVYEGSTVVHNIPLLHGQVKVGVEEVKDAEAPVPVPTDEAAVSPAKPTDGPNPQVHDPLYLMTLTIPQLFLKPLQVMRDATVFVVFNEHFPLYIKHGDLYEIAHDDQCLSISVIQLWILAHWQMVVILPMENLVVWFCSLHNRPDNYLKGIINSALKGLDDTPQPKSKAAARWIVVKYFNDARLLEAERLKALRIQWAQYYLKVKNQT
ncbi:hypothetical protein HKD37_19G053218 [Glycine soja]